MDRDVPVRLTLVSASPRRSELLGALRIPFDVVPSIAAERWLAETPKSLAQVNAKRKVERSRHFRDRSRVLLGADTIIAHRGGVLGKPIGRESARRMLETLSDVWHEVITGVWLSGPALDSSRFMDIGGAAITRVKFRSLSPRDIADYLDTREWSDKAGAYAIQGIGRGLAEHIDGDFENVIGLPTHVIHGLFKEYFGYCRFQ
ncbi:MAG: Maf family protein [bacterium]|nr:Maf family protein [bacterium]